MLVSCGRISEAMNGMPKDAKAVAGAVFGTAGGVVADAVEVASKSIDVGGAYARNLRYESDAPGITGCGFGTWSRALAKMRLHPDLSQERSTYEHCCLMAG
jgi:hypothetical protein